MRTLFVMGSVMVIAVALSACGGKECKKLAARACEMAPGTKACEEAQRMTSNDECAGFLKDVGLYVQLKNLKVTEPGVKPPAPPPPPPAETAGAVPAPEGTAPVPAPAP
mgnify:CR=1 FL=1